MSGNYLLGAVGSVITLGVMFEMLRRRRLQEKYAATWVVVAVLVLVAALVPSVLDYASSVAGVALPSNLLFFAASMVLMLVSVHHSYELGRLEERTRTLAEEIGLVRLEMEARSNGSAAAPTTGPATPWTGPGGPERQIRAPGW